MVAFWLMPAREERDFFKSLIDLLSVRFDAPRFEPHVTLFGGKDIQPKRAAQVLEELSLGGPIKLFIERVAFSDQFTKTLFVEFGYSAEAAALTSAIRSATGSKSDYELSSHLSLVYKDLPSREKAEVAQSLEMPFEIVTCDAVKVITGNAGTSGPEDVASWRTIAERRLAK